MRRRIRRCLRCERQLFCNRAGYCDSCRKQVITYGAPWAPMVPRKRTLPGVVRRG